MATKKKAKKRTKAERSKAAKLAWAKKRKGGGASSKKKSSTGKLLVTREGTHGDFGLNAEVSQGVKAAVRTDGAVDKLMAFQKESLDLIGTKIGRIVSGDGNFAEHWDDIAGYATLVANRLKTGKFV